MTTVSVSKWGNSLALRLPKHLVDDLGLTSGTEMAVGVEGRRLVARPVRRRPVLADLVKRMNAGNRHVVTDWGQPVGTEVW